MKQISQFSSYLIFLIVILFASQGFSQNVITGKIIDSETGDGISDANIVIVGTTNGTKSNEDGSFELSFKKKKIEVAISHLTYEPTRVLLFANSTSTINIQKTIYELEEINIRLGEYTGQTSFADFDEQTYESELQKTIQKTKVQENGFVVVELNAAFKGGFENFEAFIATNFQYPKEILQKDLEGTAYVVFEVLPDGNAQFQRVIIEGEDPDNQIQNELKRLFSILPKWFPAYQRGKPVLTQFVIPILYAANGYGK